MTSKTFVAKCFRTIDALIAHAKELKARADACEQEFLNFLCESEKHPHLWKPVAPTFDAFLTNFICEPGRYRTWQRAKKEIPEGTLTEIGVSGAVEALKVPEENRDEALQEMRLTARELGGPLTKQTSEYIGNKYRPRASRVVRRHNALQVSQTEVQKLQKRIKELEAEVKMLRQRNAELEAQAAPRKSRTSARA